MAKSYGVEYKIFEYNGTGKKKIFDYHACPGNISTGISLLESKIGLEMEAHSKKIIKQMRKGMHGN